MDKVFLFNHFLESEGEIELFWPSDSLIVVVKVRQLRQYDAVILLLDQDLDFLRSVENDQQAQANAEQDANERAVTSFATSVNPSRVLCAEQVYGTCILVKAAFFANFILVDGIC